MNHPNTYLFWTSGEGLTLIGAWAREGLSLAQIAGKVGVKESTLAHWRHLHPAIDAALCREKNWADAAVEEALLRKATGFTTVETTEEDSASGTKTKTTEKFVPPDLAAITLWLRVRRPELWTESGASPRDGIIREITEAVKSIE